jgi:hypothetical protein
VNTYHILIDAWFLHHIQPLDITWYKWLTVVERPRDCDQGAEFTARPGPKRRKSMAAVPLRIIHFRSRQSWAGLWCAVRQSMDALEKFKQDTRHMKIVYWFSFQEDRVCLTSEIHYMGGTALSTQVSNTIASKTLLPRTSPWLPVIFYCNPGLLQAEWLVSRLF